MPLEDLPVNVQRQLTSPRIKAENNERPSSTAPPPPRAVQSMLKTTTELGDLGQLGLAPSRLPRSGSRIQSARSRSGSFDASFGPASRYQRSPYVRRPSRHHGPRPVHSASTLSARHMSRSNLSSYAHSSRSRRHQPSQHVHPVRPLASPSPSLYTHRSLATLRSNRDVYSIRSASPLGPPPPLRGPNRTSSPGFADDRSLHTPQHGFMRAISVGTVASSPRSIYPRRGPFPGYRPDFNGSFTSLHRLPSPAYSYPSRPPYSTPVPSIRAPGPNSGSVTSLAGIPQSPSGSTVPLYYDYSESFTEERGGLDQHEDGNGEASTPTVEQVILEDVPATYHRQAQTPFGVKEGSRFQPIELPTRHNRRPSEHSHKHSHSSSKPNSRHSSKRSLTGTVPAYQASHERPAISGNPNKTPDVRRTRSEDSGPYEVHKVDLRRASTVSRRAMASSPSSGFFSSAHRSSRGLALLAARVHSPPPEATRKGRQGVQKNKEITNTLRVSDSGQQQLEKALHETVPKRASAWQLPAMTFRPMSLTYSPGPANRPRTSEAASIKPSPEIHSPMPKRPMSSQSRKRFSRILHLDTNTTDGAYPVLRKQQSRRKAPSLTAVAESPKPRSRDEHASSLTPGSPMSAVGSSVAPGTDFNNENEVRFSQVTSHDKSTVESLLDKHIECLGLQLENDATFDDNEDLHPLDENYQRDSDDTAMRLTDILARVPNTSNRPLTSTSQQYSSLVTLDRRAMRPRRLFASMDARVPGTIEEQSFPNSSCLVREFASRPSYGWQTLPSSSQLHISSYEAPTFESGELGDVDTSDTKPKLRVKRRSLVSNCASEASDLSTLSLALSKTPRAYNLHKRSKSDLVARQETHRRRRLRIRLRLKKKSKTTGDLAIVTAAETEKRASRFQGRPPLPPRVSSIKSPVDGFAELSGDSVPVSQKNLQNVLSRSPPIPNRWSSIIAAMPQPVKQSAEVVRKASVRTQRSHKSNSSVVEPINSSRVHGQIPRIGSVPQLAPPEFGPPLTSSDLNLSIPYAAAPSTIRPTLRETKSYFSDDSSANHQRRSLRRKLHLHSLRNVVPNSVGTSLLTHTPRSNNNIKLSQSCQMKGRDLVDVESSPGVTIPMTDFAYRKRRVVEKFKGWWKRQCLQKAVGGCKKREKEALAL